jgi:hypothetical protein
MAESGVNNNFLPTASLRGSAAAIPFGFESTPSGESPAGISAIRRYDHSTRERIRL